MYEALRFRRQFLLTTTEIEALAAWNCQRAGLFYLYAHPDIEVTRAVDGAKTALLVGSFFDAVAPEKGNAELLHDTLQSAGGVRGVITRVRRFAGNFSLFYQDDKHTVIMHDALGLREIYYCTEKNRIVCGSQPNLVVKFASPELRPKRDSDFVEYFSRYSVGGKWDSRCKWIGDETFYEGIKHLLPNHYLDIEKREVVRSWPTEPIPRLDLEVAVARSCDFLQGILRAMACRHPLMMAVTSGTDSRTLLAASRDIHDKVYYFINDQNLGSDHPDIAGPSEIFRHLGIPFHVHRVPEEVDEEFRRIFLTNTFFASDRILPTIYNVYFRRLGDKTNVLGIGEIGRNRYGAQPKKLNSYRMTYKLGYRGDRYAIRQGEKILDELLPVGRACCVNVMTLLYWEQTLGNWGATGNSESDIALEELNPFDSHLLYEIFLGVEPRYSRYSRSELFKRMIARMWPELLAWPINPPVALRDRAKVLLNKFGIHDVVKELKYMANYAKYRLLSCSTVSKSLCDGEAQGVEQGRPPKNDVFSR